MREGWKETTLGEIYDEEGGSVQTGPFGSQLHESDYTPEGIPVIMPKDIKEGKVDLTSIARIPEGIFAKLNRYEVKTKDIIYPRRGDITKRAYISSEMPLFCGTGCLRLRGTGQILKPKFLFYYLGAAEISAWIENQAIGATMPNLNTQIVRNIPVTLPPLPLQTRIADLLSAYDELIELNNRRIALLEQTAEQLYKEWFVRLRFPGYEQTKVRKGVPEGWEITRLKSVLETKNGKSLPKVEHYEIEAAPQLFPVFGSNGLIGKSNKFNTEDALIIGRVGAYCGSINFQPGKLWATDNTIIANSKAERFTNEFAIFFLKAINLRNFASGSAQPMLTQAIIKNQELLLPPLNLVRKFTTTVKTLNNQKYTLQTQNQTLRRTRDLLLPRLISGQLSVAEAETALNT